MTEKERELFLTAIAAEWNSWLSHEAVSLVLRSGIPRERILRRRWVLTSKSTGAAKARLVVVGFKDPDLATIERDAPTLSQAGEHLIFRVHCFCPPCFK